MRRAFRALPKDLRNAIRREQRSQVGPIWREEMAASLARTSVPARALRPQQRVFRTGTRVKAGLPMYLVAGASTRTMRGGGLPVDLDAPYEFGSNRRSNYTRYNRRSKNGTPHTVTRRAGLQLPPRQSNGYVVYPALARALPRVIGTWVHAVNQRIERAIDGS
ncbi:hypothetical protein [Cellulomonas oligotrophica]|uniref:HK97 gp10 family phage protein n=1 Tax=Cellulomonas oligotrophica TaxID=931536 RepID=A0A7Y9FI49_9CELL|nr:hypothetical protein [Cellulomonas oligotrophica]NYD87776.1 hypothetical protein [Cellulomonas oligotrophica]